MLVLGIIFSIFGVGALLCLLFTLAIYALPFFVAVTAGIAAFHSGAGVIGTILVAAFVGGATLAIGQMVFATVRSPAVRATVALLHAVPATIAGYSATHGLAETQYAVRHLADDLRGDPRNLRWVHRLRPPRHIGPTGYRTGYFGVSVRAEAFAKHKR